MENDEFRALIKLLNPGIFEYLYESGNSIKRFVVKDFQQRKEKVKEDLQAARSKIHISFDF